MKGGPLGSAPFLAHGTRPRHRPPQARRPPMQARCASCSRNTASPRRWRPRRRCWRDAPGERDALLCAAIAQRFLGRIPAALSTLATLEAQHPRFSRLYEERGRCFVEQRQAQPAIEAFREGGEPQPRAAGQLGDARGAVSHARGRRQCRHRGGAGANAARPAAGGGGRDRPVCRWRSGGGRGAGAGLPAQARRSRRGDAPAGTHRHGPQGVLRCAGAAGRRAGAGAGVPRRTPGVRLRAHRDAPLSGGAPGTGAAAAGRARERGAEDAVRRQLCRPG